MNSLQFNVCPNDIIVLHQNIRSLRKNFDSFLSELYSIDRLPDVIILTEIWIEVSEENLYSIANYLSFVKCNSNQRSGGVAVFLSDKITAYRVDSTDMITADCVHLKISLSDNKFFELLAIYRLHEYSVDNFTTELDTVLSKIKAATLMINGDININIIDKSHPSDQYIIKMASHGLKSLVNEPTRVTQISKTCIDHVFYRSKYNSNINCEAQVFRTCITDHWTTVAYIRYKIHWQKNDYKDNNKTFFKLDIDHLMSSVDKIDWNLVFSTNSASASFDCFIVKLQECIEQSHKHVRVKSKFKNPWMNNTLKRNIAEKNRLYKDFLSGTNDPILEQRYKHSKNLLLNQIRYTKKRYYSELLENNMNNSRTQWKLIKELTGNKQKSTAPIVLKDERGQVKNNPSEVANTLNNFFCSVADDLRDKIMFDRANINHVFDSYKSNFTSTTNRESIFLYPTSEEEIFLIIKSLSNNKAPGYDNITPTVIKSISTSIVHVLVYIFNLSLSSGEFPEKLKKAIITPLFKKNDKYNPSNYRPIALLSIFSKILEKIVKVRLVNFLNKHNFFSKKQFGFQSKLNTSSALMDFVSQIYTNVNNGKICAGIFVDLMKAFDMVDHDILFNRMYNAGIRGVSLEWFRSYLSGRSQITKIDNCFSREGHIALGIPQGSVLSGPLFLMYINELCNGKFKGNLVAFADDTALLYEADSLCDLSGKMQQDVNALRWWFTSNLMVMSPKTKYIIFELTKHTSFASSLKYHTITCSANSNNCTCSDLEQVENIKYLGLWVDSRLNWKEHLSFLKLKLVKYVRIFYMLRDICYAQLLRSIYFAFINSKLEYGIEIWGGTYLTTLKPLVTLQKTFIRIMLNKLRTEPSLPLFQSLNILPIRNLYVYKVLKIFFNRCDANRMNQNYVMLRNRGNMYVPRPKLSLFKKFFLYLAPTFYNLLPNNIKQCTNKNKFNKLTRYYLLMHNDINSFFNTIE